MNSFKQRCSITAYHWLLLLSFFRVGTPRLTLAFNLLLHEDVSHLQIKKLNIKDICSLFVCLCSLCLYEFVCVWKIKSTCICVCDSDVVFRPTWDQINTKERAKAWEEEGERKSYLQGKGTISRLVGWFGWSAHTARRLGFTCVDDPMNT